MQLVNIETKMLKQHRRIFCVDLLKIYTNVTIINVFCKMIIINISENIIKNALYII